MMNRIVITLGLALMIFTITPAAFTEVDETPTALAEGDDTPAALTEGDGNPAHSWERYRVLVERNIFLKERTRVTPVRESRPVMETRPSASRPERYIVLTGIVRQDGEHIAFLEDTRTRTISKVRTGSRAGDGTIESISLDYIEFVDGSRTVKVAVGNNLEGEPPATVTGSATAGTSSTRGTSARVSAPAAGIDDGTRNTLLEQMRQRRLQQLGRQQSTTDTVEQIDVQNVEESAETID